MVAAFPAPACPAVAPAAPLRHARAPLLEAMAAFRAGETVPFSTPGHKRGRGAPEVLQAALGELLFGADVWLNTADHDRALGAAEELAADAWGADRACFLTNGSSGGNHAFLLATLRPGDEVVVGRDLHQSLLMALVMSGARPVTVAPQLHPELDLGLGLAPADIAAALAAHPRAKLLALTSPTYWGVATDVAAVAAVAHARGVPVYVDEAWGPHLPFHPALPPSALAAGADAAVTSPHKLLSGLSQAAMLLLRDGVIDAGRVVATVRLTQTTSPLLPILASLDACRRQMALAGEALLERPIALAGMARGRLRRIPGVDVLDAERLGLPRRRFDRTRLVIDLHRLGLTGYEAERALRQRFGVAPEMSDATGLVCLITIGDTTETVGRLVEAIAALAAEHGPARGRTRSVIRSAGEVVEPGRQELTPREAFFAPARAVPLAEAAGAVAAELVVPYPPGIPVLLPGEVVCPGKAEYLRAVVRSGGVVRGAADPRLATLRIVDDR